MDIPLDILYSDLELQNQHIDDHWLGNVFNEIGNIDFTVSRNVMNGRKEIYSSNSIWSKLSGVVWPCEQPRLLELKVEHALKTKSAA